MSATTTPRRMALSLPRRAALRAAATPAALLAIVAVSGELRTRAIDAAYWMDEGISVGIASHPLTAIPGVLRQDGSPPLYYELLHVWIALFGSSETATHALSVLTVLACIPVAWALARTLWGARAGWAAAGLTALSPPLTYHGQETRMYPLVALLSLVVAGSLVGWLLQDRARMAWLHAAALTLLAYTHNWFLFLALAEAVVVVIAVVLSPGRRGTVLRRAAIAFGIPALLYLPWVPTVLYQSAHTGAPWSSVPGLADVWLVRTWLLAGPVALTALAIAVAVAAAALWSRRPELGQLAALAWLAGGTLLFAFAANQAKPAWADRYAVILLGPLLLLAALAVARAGAAGVVAGVLIALAWFHQPPYRDIWHRSNARVIAAKVERHVVAGDLVVDSLPESLPVMRHYLGPGLRYATTMGPTADPQVMDWRDSLHRLRHEPVADLVALADARPAGSRVVLLRPLDHGTSTNAWKEAIRVHARRLSRALRRDPGLRLVRRLRRGFYGPKTTLRAELYVRR